MAGSNLRKFTNPGFLRALEFSNLIKLLRKFDGYFSGVVHFEYDGIEQEKFNFDRLAAILVDQMMVGEYAELFDAFALIGAMSSDSREDILREFIDAQPYSNEAGDDMTAADLAVLVYLHDPEKLNEIDVEFTATKKKSFAMRATRRDLSSLEITKEHLAVFEEQLNSVFVSKHRGKTAKVYTPSREGDEYWFIIRHGDSFKRQGTVAKEKESKTLAFQPESFDLLVLNICSGELRICVPSDPQWLEECYAQTLGKALFNDFSAFEDRRNNELERLKELGEKALVYSGTAAVKRLDLISLRFLHSPDCPMIDQLTTSAGDLFRDMRSVNYNIAGVGTILEAKFAVKIGNKEKTITLKNNNRSGYDYDEFGVVVDEWLRSVGILPTSKALEKAA